STGRISIYASLTSFGTQLKISIGKNMLQI
ncbi:MAG: hypothetical protein ACI8RD_005750, partial [Bacillariaceae sp.]